MDDKSNDQLFGVSLVSPIPKDIAEVTYHVMDHAINDAGRVNGCLIGIAFTETLKRVDETSLSPLHGGTVCSHRHQVLRQLVLILGRTKDAVLEEARKKSDEARFAAQESEQGRLVATLALAKAEQERKEAVVAFERSNKDREYAQDSWNKSERVLSDIRKQMDNVANAIGRQRMDEILK